MLNKESIERLEHSEFGKSYKGLREGLEALTAQLEEINGGFGNIELYFHEQKDLKRGEFVPFVMIGVVKSDSIIDGDKITVDWAEED